MTSKKIGIKSSRKGVSRFNENEDRLSEIFQNLLFQERFQDKKVPNKIREGFRRYLELEAIRSTRKNKDKKTNHNLTNK